MNSQDSTTKSLKLLCDGFKDDMASCLYGSDQMTELLMELITDYVEENLSLISDPDTRTELAMMFMETIRITAR